MDVTELSCEELQAIVDQHQEALANYTAAAEELRSRRDAEQEEAAEKAREEKLGSDKFKKVAARYAKAMATIEELSKDQTVEFMLPVTFNFSVCTSDYGLQGRPTEKEVWDVFENDGVTATIGKVKGMSKETHALLQQGLDQIVENACEEIYGLFPAFQKQQEAAIKDFNKVMVDAAALDVTFEDLNDAA